MDNQLLKEFVILSGSDSFSDAALKLHTAQSTLSRHIQMLEKDLGKQLITRTTRRMTLTDFGTYFLSYARKAVEAHDRLDEAVARWDREENDILRIGSTYYSHLYTMTENIIGFRKKYPNVQVRTVEKLSHELALEFENGRLNLFTMAYPASHKRPEHMVINGRGRLVAIVPRDHPFASYEMLSLYRLENQPLLMPAEKNAFNRMFRDACEREGIHPEIISESHFESNMRLMKEGMGIVIEDLTIVMQHPDPDAVIIDLVPNINFYYGLVYREKLSRNELLFVRYVAAKYGNG